MELDQSAEVCRVGCEAMLSVHADAPLPRGAKDGVPHTLPCAPAFGFPGSRSHLSCLNFFPLPSMRSAVAKMVACVSSTYSTKVSNSASALAALLVAGTEVLAPLAPVERGG